MSDKITFQHAKSFADFKQDVKDSRRFYDRDSKHLRLDGAKREPNDNKVYLHRGFSGFGSTARRKRQEKRADAGEKLFKAIEQDYGRGVAEDIFKKVTGSHDERQSITLKQFDKIDNYLQKHDELKQTTAQVDGEWYESTIMPKGLPWHADRINADYVRVKDNLKGTDWTSTNGTTNQGVFGAMVRDFERSTYTVNGQELSGPDREAHGDAGRQTEECKQRCLDAGIPEDHLKKISVVLHQGIYESIVNQALEDPENAPFPFQLMQDGSYSGNDVAGMRYDLARTDSPGVYKFTAKLETHMNTIFDRSTGQPAVDQLDVAKSKMLYEFSGTFNVNDAENPVTLTNGRVGYAARLDLDGYQ